MFTKLTKMFKGIDVLCEFTGKAFSFLIPVIIVIETAEVILRYVFKNPTSWSWELCALLFGANWVMGGAWVQKEDRHVRTDVLYNLFSKKHKAILDLIFFTCLFFVYMGVMVWKTTANAIYSWSILETTFSMWGVALYPTKTIIAIGFILLTLQGIAKWIRCLIFVIKGEEI